jgi:tRNA (mo5U34)-methyltransferase
MKAIEQRRKLDFSGELAEKGWYHSFELPDGTMIPGVMDLDHQRGRFARFPIPQDLSGKRVLDIGAWDGWFSFEAERRDAGVTAIDCVEVANFLSIHRKLGSKVDYRILDFYELPQAELGRFDIVLFLGVLYHLKHPLLALEIVCALTTDLAIVESFVTDGDTWEEHSEEIPTMEFYETDELGNQLDNWIGPRVACLLAMCRAAGFARVELVQASGSNATVACYRRLEAELVEPAHDAPELVSVMNSRSLGINFSTRKDEYIACWLRTSRENVVREQLRLEAGGFGVPALHVRRDAGGSWLANFRMPPGLESGWQSIRLRFDDSGFSGALRIAVDIPVSVSEIVLKGVVQAQHAFVSCWVKGLPENCDRANVRLYASERRLLVEWIGEADSDGVRQINARLAGEVASGECFIRVECGGVSSTPVGLLVT